MRERLSSFFGLNFPRRSPGIGRNGAGPLNPLSYWYIKAILDKGNVKSKESGRIKFTNKGNGFG
jgi:hypothetical protein